MPHTQPGMHSPICGTSDLRNEEHAQTYSPRRFFDQLLATDAPVVLDVGAHRGESIRYFKSIYPNSQLYSFEPDPQNFAALEDVAAQFGSKAVCVALGENEEISPYYRQGISHLGGLLPINADSTDSLGYARQASNEQIAVSKTTLDNACAELGISHVHILKIDVQGFERQVLEGATALLRHTDCAVIEIGLYDFYGRTTSFVEVVNLMHAAGFSLWDIAKLSKNPKSLRTDWIEVVYRKDSI
ncbi:FkbM family methyltransferase [Xanthomonas phaseoli pv. dieffenbachiae]|uniref:Methyltransferase n=3 Tax=Xanthomonas TaxID=338 RepID=A0A1V9HDQ8_9XANT|nr:FkbM family methyltransferase [Xanthomonas phaseoli pv. dieffenbachiae]MBO9832854.1 FkbM family methyltransferase [Xanthomonas phaseoli pv. dieffenbachiae]MBO9835269.1 FkbM family methyltransferase [Xanthomonas phaseoli pv. dieffenbachiae]MBO9842447.1 FkbM family methyltransferase [Xanthomonas phaseoli pv. dieffenbachiae]MBO9860835.1 FkbM family methyltransferase [Xanthomonas phaseoli pv. dieffenbachiae]